MAVYSMDSITAIFNIRFCDYRTVLVEKNKTLLLLLLHDLNSANFEDRVRGAGVARWRTLLTGEGEKVRF